MKKIALFFYSLLIASVGFANSFVLNNKVTNTTNAKSKMAIQWAGSVKEVEEDNHGLKQGRAFDPNSLLALKQAGKVDINIPKNMLYFRILVWSKGIGQPPDLLTNWVDIIPNKIYTLNAEQLTPLALMSGMGC